MFLLLAALTLTQQSPVVVLILDDVGTEDLAVVPTPNIDALASQGMTFTRGYAQPWCAPCRDSLYRSTWNGQFLGDLCNPQRPRLDDGTPTVPKLFDANAIETYLFGKWHQSRATTFGIPWPNAPHLYGWDHWRAGNSSSGDPGRCQSPPIPTGQQERIDDGVLTVDNRNRSIQEREALLLAYPEVQGQSLFVVGFSDAHKPWVLPPPSILPPGYSLPGDPTQRHLFEAEIVGLDFVIGEIVAQMPADTLYILISDNGTPVEVDRNDVPTLGLELQGSKFSVFEGGVRVPFIISGGGVPSGTSDQPVSVVDIMPTLCEVFGVPAQPWMEGQSLCPALVGQPLARDWVIVNNPIKTFRTTGGMRAAIEGRWKLVEDFPGGAQPVIYDLANDPGEVNPIPATSMPTEHARLAGHLTALP